MCSQWCDPGSLGDHQPTPLGVLPHAEAAERGAEQPGVADAGFSDDRRAPISVLTYQTTGAGKGGWLPRGQSPNGWVLRRRAELLTFSVQ
ncbi:hypothetical protein [Rhodococcus koreensis]|uniref:hypothetical protein n=1 Tax=Rhodococcus koreensis TaxID=99653 RepID=UPI00366C300E